MEDISIMPGIDFKANKKRILNKKRKEERINKILNISLFIGLIILAIGILMINKNMTDSAMNNCQKLGNTYEYCIAHI